MPGGSIASTNGVTLPARDRSTAQDCGTRAYAQAPRSPSPRLGGHACKKRRESQEKNCPSRARLATSRGVSLKSCGAPPVAPSPAQLSVHCALKVRPEATPSRRRFGLGFQRCSMSSSAFTTVTKAGFSFPDGHSTRQPQPPLRDQTALDLVGADADDPHQRMPQDLLEAAVAQAVRSILG